MMIVNNKEIGTKYFCISCEIDEKMHLEGGEECLNCYSSKSNK